MENNQNELNFEKEVPEVINKNIASFVKVKKKRGSKPKHNARRHKFLGVLHMSQAEISTVLKWTEHLKITKSNFMRRALKHYIDSLEKTDSFQEVLVKYEKLPRKGNKIYE